MGFAQGVEHKSGPMFCPVLGREVEIDAAYRRMAGVTSLVDFGCNCQGDCGIPDWDPCPLYVGLCEQSPWMNLLWR